MQTKIKGTEYGHRHLGFIYKKLLALTSDGIEYKNNKYEWKDISRVERYEAKWWSMLFYPSGIPMSYIHTNDGTKIRINGKAIEEKGIRAHKPLLGVYTDAYKDLMSVIDQHIKT